MFAFRGLRTDSLGGPAGSTSNAFSQAMQNYLVMKDRAERNQQRDSVAKYLGLAAQPGAVGQLAPGQAGPPLPQPMTPVEMLMADPSLPIRQKLQGATAMEAMKPPKVKKTTVNWWDAKGNPHKILVPESQLNAVTQKIEMSGGRYSQPEKPTKPTFTNIKLYDKRGKSFTRRIDNSKYDQTLDDLRSKGLTEYDPKKTDVPLMQLEWYDSEGQLVKELVEKPEYNARVKDIKNAGGRLDKAKSSPLLKWKDDYWGGTVKEAFTDPLTGMSDEREPIWVDDAKGVFSQIFDSVETKQEQDLLREKVLPGLKTWIRDVAKNGGQVIDPDTNEPRALTYNDINRQTGLLIEQAVPKKGRQTSAASPGQTSLPAQPVQPAPVPQQAMPPETQAPMAANLQMLEQLLPQPEQSGFYKQAPEWEQQPPVMWGLPRMIQQHIGQITQGDQPAGIRRAGETKLFTALRKIGAGTSLAELHLLAAKLKAAYPKRSESQLVKAIEDGDLLGDLTEE